MLIVALALYFLGWVNVALVVDASEALIDRDGHNIPRPSGPAMVAYLVFWPVFAIFAISELVRSQVRLRAPR